MQIEPQEFLYVVNLRNARDLDIETGLNEYSWDEFKELLLTHRIRNRKDGEGYMPVLTKEEKDWTVLVGVRDGVEFRHYRGDVNIEAITSLVIDLDKPGALEQAETVFAGYEYVVHSTHNFVKETPWKYRMVIRLAEPIHVDNWPICFEALKSRIALDSVCCNPSRFYYYPSHAKDSNIAPRAFHKPGKAITLDEILDLAVDKEALHQNKFFKFKRASVDDKVLKRRHFSGSVVGRYDAVSDSIDMSYNTLLERHSKSIQDYELDGSNHNLALSVTAREIHLHGPKVDIKSTILFLFKVAADKGRALETGNTPNELPGMLINGMINYAPEAYVKLMDDHGDKVEDFVNSIIRWASLNYKSAAMTTQEIERSRELKNEAGLYQVLRERHRQFLVDYVSTGDLRKLTKNVMQMELKTKEPKYDEIAKALVNYQYGYHTKVKKMSDNAAWKCVHADSASLARFICEKNVSSAPQKLTFARSALLIECAKRVPAEIKRESQASMEL